MLNRVHGFMSSRRANVLVAKAPARPAVAFALAVAIWVSCNGVAIAEEPAGDPWLTPTSSEWSAWPDYCRARFASLPRGKRFELAKGYPAAKVEYWRKTLGAETFRTVHHYCAAINHLKRSGERGDTRDAWKSLNAAEKNVLHSLERVKPGMPLYAEMKSLLQSVRLKRTTMTDPKKDK